MPCGLECYFKEILMNLTTWKRLPKYEFERRFDALFAPFITEVLSTHLNGKVTIITPEFPLKQEDSNRTNCADYLCMISYGDASPLWLLVELKTDSDSMSQDQIECYLRAKAKGFQQLLSDLKAVAEVSNSREKYAKLLASLADLPDSDIVEIVYISPSGVKLPPDIVHIPLQDAFSITPRKHPEAWSLLSESMNRIYKG